MVLEGHEAVVAARQVIGATNPLEAAPGSIRGDYAPRGPDQPRPRLGLARVRRARDGAVLPRASPERADPRLRLARSGGRSWSSSAITFEVVVPEVEELGDGDPRATGRRERPAQGAGGGGATRARASTRSWCSTARVRQAGRRGRGRALPAPAGRPQPRGLERHRAAARTARSGPRTRYHASTSGRSSERDLELVPGHGRMAATEPAATRSRAGARRWWSGSRATTGTWSGCRCRVAAAGAELLLGLAGLS